MRKVIRRITAKRLPPDCPVDVHFNPAYDPWDQRLCVVPDGDLFKALRKGTASVVTDQHRDVHRARHPAALRGASSTPTSS